MRNNPNFNDQLRHVLGLLDQSDAPYSDLDKLKNRPLRVSRLEGLIQLDTNQASGERDLIERAKKGKLHGSRI